MKISQAVLSVAFLGVALASFAAGTVAQGRYPEINEAEGALRNAVGHRSEQTMSLAAIKTGQSGMLNRRSTIWKRASAGLHRTAIEPARACPVAVRDRCVPRLESFRP